MLAPHSVATRTAAGFVLLLVLTSALFVYNQYQQETLSRPLPKTLPAPTSAARSARELALRSRGSFPRPKVPRSAQAIAAPEQVDNALPQVRIDLKVIHIPEATANGSGFGWLLGPRLTESSQLGSASGSSDQNPTFPSNPSGMSPGPSDSDAVVQANPSGVFPSVTTEVDNAPVGQIRSADSNVPPDQLTSAAMAPLTTRATGILSDEQFRSVIHALEQRSDVWVFSFPSVTTRSGQQIQTRSSPREDASEFSPGDIAFDVIPEVFTEDRKIKLTMFASLGRPDFPRDSSITDAVNPSQPDGSSSAPPVAAAQGPVPLPRFASKPVLNTVTVPDGQTVLMSGLIPPITSNPNAPATRRLWLITVTPTIVDATDNLDHADSDAVSDHNSRPPLETSSLQSAQ